MHWSPVMPAGCIILVRFVELVRARAICRMAQHTLNQADLHTHHQWNPLLCAAEKTY